MTVSVVTRIGVRWESLYPVASGAAGALVGYAFGPNWIEHVHANGWIIENLFVAIFTLGTVAAGFGLTIYTFLLTTESGFIGHTKSSIYYRHLLTYVLKATILSAAVAFLSIPGMVIKDAPALYISAWAGVTAWTGAALFRAGHLFSIFAKEHH
jgi:hypothetical protein